MHELSITESIIDIAVRHAQQNGAHKITGLHIVMGQLSSFVDESIQFFWEIISRGTIAENAKLSFRRIPAKFLCLDCNQEYFMVDDTLACPSCQSVRVKILSGNELFLEAIDVET